MYYNDTLGDVDRLGLWQDPEKKSPRSQILFCIVAYSSDEITKSETRPRTRPDTKGQTQKVRVLRKERDQTLELTILISRSNGGPSR